MLSFPDIFNTNISVTIIAVHFKCACGYKTYHIFQNGPIIDTKSGLCMTVNATTDKLFLAECRDLPSQHWAFRFYTKDYDQPHIDNIPVKSRIKSIIKMFTGLVRNRITWPYFGLPKLQTVI